MSAPASMATSAEAVFDSTGKLMTLKTVGPPNIEYVADGPFASGETEPLYGTLIWHEVPPAGTVSSYRSAKSISQAGPTKDHICYIISINAAIVNGTLFRTGRIPKNPITGAGKGTWKQNGPRAPTVNAQTSYEYFLALQKEIIYQVESFKPQGNKFVKVDVPKVDGDNVISSCYVLENINTIDDPKHPGYEPIEKAGIVVTLAKNRLVPSQDAQSAIQGPNEVKSKVFIPSEHTHFDAAHLSVMIHPRSPNAPICHTSFRHFELFDKSNKAELSAAKDYGFGGALHLMPSLQNDEQFAGFHKSVQRLVQPHGEDLYSSTKDWADSYFYDHDRGQALGIGGVFFDRMSEKPHPQQKPGLQRSLERCGDFLNDLTQDWSNVFIQHLQKSIWTPWKPEDRLFQLKQRCDIIEYFYMKDLGFRFGLATKSGSLPAMRIILPPNGDWLCAPPKTELSDRAKGLLGLLRGPPKNWAEVGN